MTHISQPRNFKHQFHPDNLNIPYLIPPKIARDKTLSCAGKMIYGFLGAYGMRTTKKEIIQIIANHLCLSEVTISNKISILKKKNYIREVVHGECVEYQTLPIGDCNE
jgi:hypothetical protein